VLRTCQHRSRAAARRWAAQLRVVRVGRARRDATVGVFEQRLEEQSGTGEVSYAMHGAEWGLRV
jgi:hypothetical protein